MNAETHKNTTFLPKHSQCVHFQTEKCSKIPSGFNDPEGIACIHFEPVVKWQKITAKGIPVIEKITQPIGQPIEYGSQETLFKEIIAFLKNHVCLEYDCEYGTVAAWVCATWIQPKTNKATYLVVYGPSGHGKTWLLDVLALISYRGIPASSVTKAAIPRLLDNQEATLLLDESEFYDYSKFRKSDSIYPYLNSMYRRGQYSVVLEEETVEDEEGKRKRAYQARARALFGFVALASRKDIFDATADRAIELRLPKKRPPNRHLDIGTAATLRQKLHQFRLDILDMAPLNEVPPELRTLDVRVEDNFEFLFMATPKNCQSDLMTKLKLDVESREARIRDSVEYELVATIKQILMGDKEDLGDKEDYPKPNPLIIEGKEKEQYLKIADITSTFNADKPEGKQMDSRQIGRTLHKLRFNAKIIKPAGKSTRAVEINKEHIDSLLGEYFLGKPVTSSYINGVPEAKEGIKIDKKSYPTPFMYPNVTEQGFPKHCDRCHVEFKQQTDYVNHRCPIPYTAADRPVANPMLQEESTQ